MVKWAVCVYFKCAGSMSITSQLNQRPINEHKFNVIKFFELCAYDA